ncbi:hypothetical protein, partial [Campylobacter insulaenigrae]
MVDTINIINTIKEKFTLDADKKEFFVMVLIGITFFIFISLILVGLIVSIKANKNTSWNDYDFDYNRKFERNDTGSAYPTDPLNPLSHIHGLYKD